MRTELAKMVTLLPQWSKAQLSSKQVIGLASQTCANSKRSRSQGKNTSNSTTWCLASKYLRQLISITRSSIRLRQLVCVLSGQTVRNGTYSGQVRPNQSIWKKPPSTKSSTTSHSLSKWAARTWCGRICVGWSASLQSSISAPRHTCSQMIIASSAWIEKLTTTGTCISWSLALLHVVVVSKSSDRSKKLSASQAMSCPSTSATHTWSMVSSTICAFMRSWQDLIHLKCISSRKVWLDLPHKSILIARRM